MLATSLEQFVQQHRNEIDEIRQQHAAMSARERGQFADTIKLTFGARDAAVEKQADGVDACKSEPRVRAALRDFGR